jgi:hypothetical protein
MLRYVWHFLFGGCMHDFKWERHDYDNAVAQWGTCTKCGYIKECVIANIENDSTAQSREDATC